MKITKVNTHTIEVAGKKLSLNTDIDEIKTAGTDYCVYYDKTEKWHIIESNGNLDKKRFKKVGGFHYGLIPEDFKAINNIDKKHAKKIRGINAYSIWDINHRPECEPKSMVYIPKLKIWVDIYLLSSTPKERGSLVGRAIACGDEYNGRKVPDDKQEFKYSDFEEAAKSLQKRFIKEEEFVVAMSGVKENESAGDLDDGTIKHIADFTSKYGIEQATGVQWVWGEKIDRDNTEYAVRLGGNRDSGVYAGSRASVWSYYVWYSNWHIGCRFACDPLNLKNEAKANLSKEK